MSSRWLPGPSLLGLLTGWVALFAWRGMVTEPSGFLGATLALGLVAVLAGGALRLVGIGVVPVVLAQLTLGLLGLNVIFAGRESFANVLPTLESAQHLVLMIGNGAATLNYYPAPVEVNALHTRAMLTACGLAVVVAIDLLAMGLRHASAVALPLLIVLSVPIAILSAPLSWPVLVLTALLFLRLLATEHRDLVETWTTEPTTPGTGGRAAVGRVVAGRTRSPAAPWWQVSVLAVLIALLVAPLIPVTDLLGRGRSGAGDGDGVSAGFVYTSVNPFIRLRRDLVAQDHIPMVYVRTSATATAYLRTTVLDKLTEDAWEPSSRELPAKNSADGPFPSPPGLAPGTGGSEDRWSFELAAGFATTWLPLPYPVREVEIADGWRFDARTLDVAFVDGAPPPGVRYRVRSFSPSITAARLSSALGPPDRLQSSMTKLPDGLPEVVRTRARQVTRDAKNDFERAVALQDWFRQDGGFRYSLAHGSGSGLSLLRSFLTDDRVGYCEQFAAAMAAMGRTLGIPSRVVVGFLDGTTESDGRILYTSDDRHAWPEMYFSGVGWVRFEPTPAQRTGATPAWTRQSAQVPTAPAASPAPDAGHVFRADRAAGDRSTAGRQGIELSWWLLAGLLLLLLMAVLPALLRRRQRWRRLTARPGAGLPEGAWAELRASALDLGLDWPEGRSPREQAGWMADVVTASEAELGSLADLLVRVEEERFAPVDAGVVVREPGRVATGVTPGIALDGATRSRLLADVHVWRGLMSGCVPRRRRWRARVWPASLVRGRLP